MKSQKKCSLKNCIKCGVLLTDENWLPYLQKRSHYICKSCFSAYNKVYHKLDIKYNIKQRSRYRERKSAVIHAYGDQCKFCGENDYYKLTIDYNNSYIQRQKINDNIYNWLYNNPITDNYQVLCYNCSCSKNIIYKDKYFLKDKKIVIKEYGQICNECGEDKIERLIIDYKNNDGAEQRCHLKCYTGARMYRWLIKNKFPNHLGLQILCHNCNYSKKSLLNFDRI